MTSRTATADWAMDLTGVEKIYRGRVRALRGIDMRVGRGEIFGLLGPNGAGKSTLVKILMTVIRPTRCSGHVLGMPVGHKPTLRRIGYLPEHHRFPDYLTGAQVMDFFGALSAVPRAERRRRSAALLDTMGISAWAGKRVRGYSKGMRQRLGIAQALMSDPDLILLDEPTDGVDPVGRREIVGVLADLRAAGKTIFINSHLLSELERISDRVAIIVQGAVASQGTLDSLTRDQERYEIEFDPGEAEAALRAVGAAAPGGALSTGEKVDHAAGRISVRTTDAARVQGLLDSLRAQRVVIRSVRPVRPSLEDLFMQAVTDPATGRPLPPGAKEGGAARG